MWIQFKWNTRNCYILPKRPPKIVNKYCSEHFRILTIMCFIDNFLTEEIKIIKINEIICDKWHNNFTCSD